MTSDVQDHEAVKKMLLSQETTAYKTITNNDSGVAIKAKMIKYDRLCFWGGLERKDNC